MNAFQKCRNTSDAVPLYLPQQLFLKPIARMNITIHLPQKLMGKSISNWELMEKLRTMISPDEFTVLKVTKSTIEFIRFEAEVDDKSKLEKVTSKLDGKLIKLKEFHDLFKVRASEARQDFANKHVWDSFFRDAKDMNELKPGERPDTIHISNLPIRWFVPYHLSGEEDLKPSEKIFYRVFEKFGHIRYVDIPICDPYRKQMKAHISGVQTFSFDEKDFFEGYVQFKDYISFSKTMDALRGMKLLHKDEEFDEIYTVNIKVDFDKSKHMSDASIKRREIVRERLIRKEKLKVEEERKVKEDILKKEQAERQKEIDLKNEKESRRRQREEKRKAKILSQLKVKEADEINDKIAKEEKKLLKAQRKLEAIRLIEELFNRIKNKHENNFTPLSKRRKGDVDEITRYKTSSELELRSQREKLHCAIEGRVVLKTILAGQTNKHRSASSSSDTSLSLEENEVDKEKDVRLLSHHPSNMYPVEPNWYPYSSHMQPYVGALYHSARGNLNYYPHIPRGRNMSRGPGSSRGFSRRGRGSFNPRYRGRGRGATNYPPELQEEYYRYFQKFLQEGHDDRDYRSYSRSRSRSKSRSHSRHRRSSSRRSRSRKRSYSRSRRSYSRSRSRDRRSSFRSRSRSKSRLRSSSRPKLHARKSSHSRSRSKTRLSRSLSRSKRSRSGKDRPKSKSRSVKSRSHSREKRKSRSMSYKSVDSSKFMSPNRLRNRRSRSWSLRKETDKPRRSSWSKTPSL